MTLATIDNSIRINFQGIVQVNPQKTGLTKIRTMHGKLILRWRGEYNNISVTFNYLTAESYQNLLSMWSQSTRELVLTTNNGTYTGMITDEKLQLNEQRDNEGNLFYSGTINMED